MVLMIHILAALSSLLISGMALFWPSQSKLTTVYLLTGLTLASGFYLVLTSHQHILQTCVSGLVYLAVVSVGIFSAKRKLAALS